MSKRQTAESTCPRCLAAILWTTQSKGGRLPLDLAPQLLTAASVGPFYTLDELEMISNRADAGVIELAIANNRKLFTNHVVTCVKGKGQQSNLNFANGGETDDRQEKAPGATGSAERDA